MDMPTDLSRVIQSFAKPMTRGDWRTCKREESRAISLLLRDTPHVVADQIGAEFWDVIVSMSLYDLLRRYQAGPPSEEGQTTTHLTGPEFTM